MIYTDEQLVEFVDNSRIFRGISDVLEILLDEEGLSMKEIGIRSGMSIYPRDKVILALEFAGFITKMEMASAKIYMITDQGRKLHSMIRRNQG